MEHEPSGLLGNADGFRDLIAADSVFAVGNHPSSGKPLVQRDRGIFKNRFGFDGKLLAAFGALPDAASLKVGVLLPGAVWTNHAIFPAQSREELYADVGV